MKHHYEIKQMLKRIHILKLCNPETSINKLRNQKILKEKDNETKGKN